MPWVGLGFITLQENYTITRPGGEKLLRLLAKCSCGWDVQYSVSGPEKDAELARGMGRIAEHWSEHLK